MSCPPLRLSLIFMMQNFSPWYCLTFGICIWYMKLSILCISIAVPWSRMSCIMLCTAMWTSSLVFFRELLPLWSFSMGELTADPWLLLPRMSMKDWAFISWSGNKECIFSAERRGFWLLTEPDRFWPKLDYEQMLPRFDLALWKEEFLVNFWLFDFLIKSWGVNFGYSIFLEGILFDLGGLICGFCYNSFFFSDYGLSWKLPPPHPISLNEVLLTNCWNDPSVSPSPPLLCVSGSPWSLSIPYLKFKNWLISFLLCLFSSILSNPGSDCWFMIKFSISLFWAWLELKLLIVVSLADPLTLWSANCKFAFGWDCWATPKLCNCRSSCKHCLSFLWLTYNWETLNCNSARNSWINLSWSWPYLSN